MQNNHETECLQFLEETLGDVPLTEAGRAHLSTCETCREIRKTITCLKTRKSAFPADFFAATKLRVLTSLYKQSEPTKWWWMRPIYYPTIQYLSFAVLALIIFIIYAPVLYYKFCTYSPQLQENSRSRDIVVPSGVKTTWNSPGGAHLEIIGPARLIPTENGISAEEGDITVSVLPSKQGFTMITPHCTIKVLGTKFRCFITIQKTKVEVFSGLVWVATQGQEPIILKASETAELTSKSPKRSKTIVIPAPDTDESLY